MKAHGANSGLTRSVFTRRALAGYMAAPVLLSSAAQAQAPAAAPAVAPARNRFEETVREFDSVKLPRNIEPASRFEA